MAAAAGGAVVWEPQVEGVVQICRLLTEYMSPGADQARILRQLQACAQFPDFNNYLAHVLTRAENQPAEVRQSAGLLLKNNLKTGYVTMPVPFQAFLRAELLRGMGAPDRHLRSTVGTVISVIVQAVGVAGWPDLLDGVAKCIDSGDYNHMEGALDALFKICEDMPEQLDQDVPGLAERPVNFLIPRLLKLFSSQHAVVRKYAVGSVNQFTVQMPLALVNNMNMYLQGLFSLAHDTSADVRKLVCAGLVALLEVQPEVLQANLRAVIEYMLGATQDANEEVALEACEFWSAYCEARCPPELLREFLPRLVPILLKNMVYADDDEAVLAAEEEDDAAPDRQQDLKPFIHRSRMRAEGEGDDEDDDDEVNTWNLRKCSAAGLDILSNIYGDELLPFLMPLAQAKLQDTSDMAWKEREAAVLALGAVAEGCIGGLMPHLPQLMAVLLRLLEDPRPLVRSIACWTISRYSKWVTQGSHTAADRVQFEAMLMSLLQRILDNSKRVQEAACSAFATEAAADLAPHLEPILQHLMFAYGKYQRKNLRILYDAIGTLADAVGGELNEPKYISILMPPLIDKWQRLSDTDKDLFPLLECLTSIAQALGPGFAEYAEHVFRRCINIVQLMQLVKTDQQPGEYDKEFVVCALDLLSGLAEGLGTAVESLVGSGPLRELLLQCCSDEAADVRQSSFALLGDLAKASIVHLRPSLADFLSLATKNLAMEAVQKEGSVSVCNNACWAIGEIAVKVQGEMAPYVMSCVSCIVPILSMQGLNKSLLVNSAITLGRLGWVCPEQVAPHLEHFMVPWCQALRTIRDDIEKEHAFYGLCAMVSVNPAGAASAFVQMSEAIASWQEVHNDDLAKRLASILHGYKHMLGDSWPQYFGALQPPVRNKLASLYTL
eukprot:jgi/Chlat1/8762/Chrsp90S08112